MTQTMLAPAKIIADELNVKEAQVNAAIQLLDEGATVPFIARYRKEATQGLDDTQLRALVTRVHYLRELDERRGVILQSIREQDKLTDSLEQAILTADTKTRLEDLYLPYRPKRRTKALLAKEAGLEPLAMDLWQTPSLDPQAHAQSFINAEKGIEDVRSALEGARQILMERFAEEAELIAELRQHLWQHGVVSAVKGKNAQDKEGKFADYYNFSQAIKSIPSHRALALFRGRREGALQLSLSLLNDQDYGFKRMAHYFGIETDGPSVNNWLLETVANAWKIKLFTKLELELFTQLREMADEEAIHVFVSNLRDILLAAPAGAKVTMGLDPGIRTGVKVAIVDNTGKLLDYTTVFPFAPQNEWHNAIATLAKCCAKFNVDLISIGNGTASRETERLVAELIKMYPDLGLNKVVVSEAGASVYSASEYAAIEFPDLDVSIRGAVSIARRLQDPLAELVKIEPKSIGVGQYQHDVNQTRLAQSLEAVVEDCVNLVGVDVNMASVPLLTHVSGLNEAVAKNIVQYRDEHGAFVNRESLKQVPRMGEKTFQQCAGFLRIAQAENPLDASAVHPEAYPLVERIVNEQKIPLNELIGHVEKLRAISATAFVDEQFGLMTVQDVLKELEKPGRDPRPEFKTVRFKEGVEDITHLEEGMILEGVVSNVTNFGAFVDIGVHQDGLVHISAMTERFTSDPRTIVKAGDIITVKVVEVDVPRRRVGLSMKLNEKSSEVRHKEVKKQSLKPQQKQVKRHKNSPKVNNKAKTPSKPKKSNVFNTAMADALSKLKQGAE